MAETKRKSTSTKKTTTTKKPSSKTTTKKPTTRKTNTTKKTTNTKPRKNLNTKTSNNLKTQVKRPSTKNKEKVKKDVEKVFENKEVRKRKGKTFYLFFSLIFFAGAFFYINNVIYDNQSYIESALFAFTIVFVLFILLNFNVHRMIINFFLLPIKYLLDEAKPNKTDTIIESSNKYSRFRAILTITIYTLILLLLMGSQVWNGIIDEDKVLVIITQSLSTGFVFLVIVCSWQYIFNIIPNVLENTIDAKNGFVLSMSAIVMIVYVVFIIFDIKILSELMIFVLIIGFIALLGVNLNMIVGEFNIFKNLRQRANQSKTITRMVFMIFFSFHLYVILYASVVAYSIYVWDEDSYNFTNFEYTESMVTGVEYNNTLVTDVYDYDGTLITTVYDKDKNVVTEFIDDEGTFIKEFYRADGSRITGFYMTPTDTSPILSVNKDGVIYYHSHGEYQFTYYEGTLVGITKEEVPHTYGDMLYYAVITISSIGYGDISPNSNVAIAQFWGGFLSIYGITFYALSIGYVSNIAGMALEEKREED